MGEVKHILSRKDGLGSVIPPEGNKALLPTNTTDFHRTFENKIFS